MYVLFIATFFCDVCQESFFNETQKHKQKQSSDSFCFYNAWVRISIKTRLEDWYAEIQAFLEARIIQTFIIASSELSDI